MPLKIAILLRVWLPLATIAAFFAFRLPTQADASPLEVTAAMLLIPALTLLAAWSAAELMFRPAALKLDKVVAEVLDGEPTEPLLLTHEFQPASSTPEQDLARKLTQDYLHAKAAQMARDAQALVPQVKWVGDPATSNMVMFSAEPKLIKGMQAQNWANGVNYLTQMQNVKPPEFPASIGDLFAEPGCSPDEIVYVQTGRGFGKTAAQARLRAEFLAKSAAPAKFMVRPEYPFLGAKHRLDESAIRTDT